MLSKQKELYTVIEKINVQLRKLETEREIAAINKEMAKLGATAEGVNIGDIGKVLDTIQEEIDELNATTEVYNEEAGKPTGGNVFSKPDLTPAADGSNTLDALWD